MPQWDVHNCPVLEEDDKGVKFVCSFVIDVPTFASITNNNKHIILVVIVVVVGQQCQGGANALIPARVHRKCIVKDTGEHPTGDIFPQTYIQTRGSTCNRRSANQCALMICVSVFIL